MFRSDAVNPYADKFGMVLKCGVSAIALTAMTAPAIGQTTPAAAAAEPSDSGPKEITITGIRASLANSQNIKRNADTVVDAITASDIGALPDRSVTEALQRVPGVAMNRFAGSNDPDHFSVEGSGVVVRGLNFVRSEFNGRDTFAAGVGGQAINFADVPAELLGSVEVYKNATSEMIEGGLAGTVNLNTRKPFDSKGLHIGVDVEANYGDLEKRLSPTWSALISNTWDTGIGRIGLLASASFSQIRSQSNGVSVSNIQTRDNTIAVVLNTKGQLICRNPLPGTADTTTLPPSGSACGAASTAGADGLLDPADVRYAPIGGQFRQEDYNRKRRGISLAAQWESLDRRATLTAQFLRTSSENAWGEHTFETGSDLSEYNTYPYGCQQNQNGPSTSNSTNNGATTRAECPVGTTRNYTYDNNGVFEKGYITAPGGGWRGNVGTAVVGGMQQSLSRGQIDERNRVTDYGLNFKFAPNDRLSMNLDADYTQAQHDNLDFRVFGSTFADEELDLTGNLPTIIPHKPLALTYSWATPDPKLVAESDSQYFTDRNNEFWRAAMDHAEHSTGHEWAGKADFVYKFGGDDPFFKHVKFGARYADREETVRYTTYNWGALSEVWGGTGPVSMAKVPQNTDFFTFKNFFRGATAAPPSAYYYNGDMIGNYNSTATFFKSIAAQGIGSGWVPLAERTGAIAGTPYLPNEIQDVSQKSKDAYVMLSFGRDTPIFGNVKMSGNIGLRYVNTRVRSGGSIFITQQSIGVDQSYAQRCATPSSPPPGLPPGVVLGQPGGICQLGPDTYAQLQKFGSGAATSSVAGTKDDQWLPSLNLKFDLTRNLLVRLAASKVMTLPDLASIRNSFGASFNTTDNSISFSLGNPLLKPATAQQFDVTAEWYFAKVGSLTVNAFYKRVHNFFYAAQIARNFTQNGVTIPIEVRIPSNYNGYGKVMGFEAAYQQTFDFLPGLFSGLGTNLSYTYLKSSGLPNSFLNGGNADNSAPTGVGRLPLEQLSKHNINATLFYEKGPLSLRAAYTWRSRFLLTAADVIQPYFPIYNGAEGHLDASAFLTLTKGLRIGVQGVNLNNAVTKTLQQFTTSGKIGPRSYFISDRRYSFIMRGSW